MNHQQNFSNAQNATTPGEIIVKVKPSAKEESIKKEGNLFYISIKEPAEDNKANKAVIKLLGKYLKKKLRIKRGLKSKEKILVEI